MYKVIRSFFVIGIIAWCGSFLWIVIFAKKKYSKIPERELKMYSSKEL